MSKAESPESPKLNINLEAVDVAIVNRYLRRAGIKKQGDLSARVTDLQQHYLSAMSDNPDILAAECETCGAHSPFDLPECPFCGDSETQDPATDIEPWQPKAVEDGVEYSIVDLDEAVNEIRRHAKLAAVQVFKVGQALKWIQDSKLWTLRLTEAGGKLYKGFYDFCKAELNISHVYAIRLVKISTEYTPEQIREYGMTRLAFSLKLPKEQRDDFLEMSKEMSAHGNDLGAEVKKRKDEIQAGQPGALPVPKIISVPTTLELGINRVPLWKRPHGDHPVGRPTSPATTLSDEPWFHSRISDEVSLVVKLVRTVSGDMEAQVEIKKAMNV